MGARVDRASNAHQDSLPGGLTPDDPTGAPYMTLVAPLQSSSSFEPVATLLLKIDPERFLYPSSRLADASGSAETLLVRAKGRSRLLE